MDEKKKKLVAIIVSALISLAISTAAGVLGISESELMNYTSSESCIVQSVDI